MADALTRLRSLLAPGELVRRVTGTDLSPAPFLRYLRRKYGEIYGIA